MLRRAVAGRLRFSGRPSEPKGVPFDTLARMNFLPSSSAATAQLKRQICEMVIHCGLRQQPCEIEKRRGLMKYDLSPISDIPLQATESTKLGSALPLPGHPEPLGAVLAPEGRPHFLSDFATTGGLLSIHEIVSNRKIRSLGAQHR